jgi:hypothetical protein
MHLSFDKYLSCSFFFVYAYPNLLGNKRLGCWLVFFFVYVLDNLWLHHGQISDMVAGPYVERINSI